MRLKFNEVGPLKYFKVKLVTGQIAEIHDGEIKDVDSIWARRMLAEYPQLFENMEARAIQDVPNNRMVNPYPENK